MPDSSEIASACGCADCDQDEDSLSNSGSESSLRPPTPWSGAQTERGWSFRSKAFRIKVCAYMHKLMNPLSVLPPDCNMHKPPTGMQLHMAGQKPCRLHRGQCLPSMSALSTRASVCVRLRRTAMPVLSRMTVLCQHCSSVPVCVPVCVCAPAVLLRQCGLQGRSSMLPGKPPGPGTLCIPCMGLRMHGSRPHAQHTFNR